mgnify:CR=1 FL=1
MILSLSPLPLTFKICSVKCTSFSFKSQSSLTRKPQEYNTTNIVLLYWSISLSWKDEKTFSAPEDHYGFIFTLSAYLIDQQIKNEIKEDLQKELFKTVINLYCDELFYKLIGSSSKIYSHVGLILGNICNFERAYLDISKVKN